MSGESSRLSDVLFKVISKVQSLYIKQRFAKGVQRNITDLCKAWIITDSKKIFLLHFVLYLLHLQNSERRFQNCALRLYNFLHAALRCSSFCFKTVICLRLYLLCSYLTYPDLSRPVRSLYEMNFVADLYNVVGYWKTVSLYSELINLSAV